MTVEQLSKNKIRINLTEDEVLTFFGGYDLIDYKVPAAKKMLHLLLKEALPDEMLPIDCTRVLIEVKPQSGGCAIFFTKMYENGPKRLRKIPQTKSYALKFKSSNDLLDFARCAEIADINNNSLYMANGTYTLIINADKSICSRLTHIEEFCEISDNKTELSKIWEHGHIICKEGALEKIKKALKAP